MKFGVVFLFIINTSSYDIIVVLLNSDALKTL